MMITAHGGAQKTGNNSPTYLEAVRSGKIAADCFEVDVRYTQGLLYLSHMPTFFPKKKVPLLDALLLAKEKNMQINLDLKQFGTLAVVQELVLSLGMDEEIIYTGNTSPSDVDIIKAGRIYANVNKAFFHGLRPTAEDAEGLVKALESYRNPRLRGVNINYRWTEPRFYPAAFQVKLPVSVYTIDDEIALEKLVPYNFENITTHRPDLCLAYLKGEKK